MSNTMLKAKEVSVNWEADHEQYWQGHGIAFTQYTHCSTGCGSTLREALEDALSGLGDQDIELTEEQEKELELELANDIRKPFTLDTSIVDACCDDMGQHTIVDDDGEETEDEDPDCAVCSGEWHFYVNVDVIAE